MSEGNRDSNQEPRIRDIPKFKELLEDVDSLSKLSKVIRFLRLFGYSSDNLDTTVARLPELKKKVEHFVELPDRFNDIFGSHGLIAYKNLNVDVMQKALEIAENESTETAEKFLADHYDEEIFNLNFTLHASHSSIYTERELSTKSKARLFCGRYHASVPVVLSLLDGLVNDVAKDKGFFAEGVQLAS